MATLYSSTLMPTNGTTALFRAWVQFVHDLFVTTGGWVNTADTGQVDIATVAIPTVGNQKSGYKIYRMNDALQSAAPVYIRIDFGASTAGATTPGIWLTVGQSSDGAGNILNIRYNGGAVVAPQVAPSSVSATGTHDSYGSAGPDRFAMSLFTTSAIARNMVLSIERLRDTDGNLRTHGLYIAYGFGSQFNRSMVVALNTSVQPFAELCVQYVLSTANPSAYDGNVGIGLPIPMMGIAQPPATNFIIVRANDFQVQGQIRVVLYEESIIYQHIISQPTTLDSFADTTARCAIRYD